MKKTLNVFAVSNSFDPWFNLAVEEYLLKTAGQSGRILYLWQNDRTVVIGANQNPWKECDTGRMKEDRIKLARRLSGGGAVYHDMGNLNFTFIMPNSCFDQEKQLGVILEAVNSFGADASFSGRNDLTANGCKFSGNAYYYDELASYHHGTLLIDSDLVKLSEYLHPSRVKIISKGVDSVRSRVTNLSSLSESITVEEMKKRIFCSFEHAYGKMDKFLAFEPITTPERAVLTLYEKYSSWDWIYGESPAFDAYYEERFDWGEVQIGFLLKDGWIEQAQVYSDALNTAFIKKLGAVFRDVKFSSDNLKSALASMSPDKGEEGMFRDVLQMF